MMRIETLQSIFPSHLLLANNRDPYANISSMFYRYTKDIGKLNTNEREVAITRLAEAWLKRSYVLRKIIQSQGVPYLSYERFCENPTLLQEIVDSSLFKGQIKLDFKKNLNVKDYEPQPLINFNSKQIEKLNSSDIETITKFLQESVDLLSYFGYTLRN